MGIIELGGLASPDHLFNRKQLILDIINCMTILVIYRPLNFRICLTKERQLKTRYCKPQNNGCAIWLP